MTDWNEETKARLKEFAHISETDFDAKDDADLMRSALARIEELEREVERPKGELPGKLRGERALAEEKIRCFLERAEAAEAKVKELEARLGKL